MGSTNAQMSPQMLRPNYLGMVSPGFFTTNPYAQFPGVPQFPNQPPLGSFLTPLNAPPRVANVPGSALPPAPSAGSGGTMGGLPLLPRRNPTSPAPTGGGGRQGQGR